MQPLQVLLQSMPSHVQPRIITRVTDRVQLITGVQVQEMQPEVTGHRPLTLPARAVTGAVHRVTVQAAVVTVVVADEAVRLHTPEAAVAHIQEVVEDLSQVAVAAVEAVRVAEVHHHLVAVNKY